MFLSIDELLDPEYGHVTWEIRRRAFWESRGFSNYGPPGTIRLVAEANLANGDEEAASKLLDDWMRSNGKLSAKVSRYVPGLHFHALNEKFPTYEAAAAHIRLHGMIVEPEILEYRVRLQGD